MSFDVGISRHVEPGSVSAAHRLATSYGRPFSPCGLGSSAGHCSQSQTAWVQHDYHSELNTPHPAKDREVQHAPYSTNIRRGNRVRRRPAWYEADAEECHENQRHSGKLNGWVTCDKTCISLMGQEGSKRRKDCFNFELPVIMSAEMKKDNAHKNRQEWSNPPPSPASCEAASTLVSFTQLTQKDIEQRPASGLDHVDQQSNEQVPRFGKRGHSNSEDIQNDSGVVCLVRLIGPPNGFTPKRSPCVVESQLAPASLW